MRSRSTRQPFLRGMRACVVLMCVAASPAYAQANRRADMNQGCPYRDLTAKVKSIFGAFDAATSNSGAIEGAEIPNVAKVRQLTMYTCVFQRRSTMESLQVIANVYPSDAEAESAFTEASHVKNAAGPYYTSSRTAGKMQVFEGPGRSLTRVGYEVVIVHWQAFKAGRIAPVDKPGSVLTPIAEVWFGPLLK